MKSEPVRRQPIKRETLADRVAANITESILSGALGADEALPTEPELAKKYGVSRSVIRDATRLLSARGLVDVKHGKGVFVTASQDESFTDALLLALRRDGATAWDYFEFSEPFTPLIVSLATVNATDEEINEIERLANLLLQTMSEANTIETREQLETFPFAEIQDLQNRFDETLFAATHNKVVQRLAGPLQKLRKLNLFDIGDDAEGAKSSDIEEVDRKFFDVLIACLRSRDPGKPFAALRELIELPPEAVQAMKQTPIGEMPYIVLASPESGPGKEEDIDG